MDNDKTKTVTRDEALGLLEGVPLMVGCDDLAHSLIAALDRAEKAEADNARLRRVLAVERGDEAQAPAGWALEHDYEDSRWVKGDSHNFDDEPWAIVWPSLSALVRWEAHTGNYSQNAEETAASVLDALEAADAALDGFDDQ